MPGFNVSAWYSLFVPAKTPPDIVKKIHADTAKVLAEPAVKKRMEQVGVMVVGIDAGRAWRASEIGKRAVGPVIKAAGIKSED